MATSPFDRLSRNLIVCILVFASLASGAHAQTVFPNTGQIQPSLGDSLSLYLDQDQDSGAAPKKKTLLQQLVPLISVGYEWYLPSAGLARSIFGDVCGSFTFSLSDFEVSPNKRVFFGFATDSIEIGGSGNKLFVLTPEATFEYRVPLAQHFSAFAGLAAGPSYMDYSFNELDGVHFAAKRLGAEVRPSVGLRYARLEVEASYHALTEPAGISFNGLQISATYIVVRF